MVKKVSFESTRDTVVTSKVYEMVYNIWLNTEDGLNVQLQEMGFMEFYTDINLSRKSVYWLQFNPLFPPWN